MLLIGAYAVIFVMVSCSTSPTNTFVQTASHGSLAYMQSPGGDLGGGRIILLHGAPADASAWSRLLARADEIKASTLITVDRVGYGNSLDEDELSLTGHASSILPLLVEVNGRKHIIIGHSYGGPVALRLAVDYPDQVGGIVLVAGACDAYMNDAQWFRRGINGIRLLVPTDWERANRELLALTDENLAMEPLLRQVTCPVVVIHGTWDGVCPHDTTIAYLRERLVNAEGLRVVSIDRGGHNLHLSNTDELIDAINATVTQTVGP